MRTWLPWHLYNMQKDLVSDRTLCPVYQTWPLLTSVYSKNYIHLQSQEMCPKVGGTPSVPQAGTTLPNE